MPDRWRVPVPASGSAGLRATIERGFAIHRIGNLALLTQQLNASVSNGPWIAKRDEISKNSLLPLNRMVIAMDVWDENAMARRAADLLKHALKVWNGPPSKSE